MSVRELKEELKAGGVNTAGMLEKEDLTAAVKNLRLAPPSEPATAAAPPTGKHRKKGGAATRAPDGEAGARANGGGSGAAGKAKPATGAQTSTVPPDRSFSEMQLLISSGTATCDQCLLRRGKLQSCRGCKPYTLHPTP